MNGWAVNKPDQLTKVLAFMKVLPAPMARAWLTSLSSVVLQALKWRVMQPFLLLGRGDASEDHTDADSFAHLEMRVDGFRNYLEKDFAVSPEEMMLDKAQLLELTPAEMTVLVGGMRSLGISATGDGVWSDGNSLDNNWFNTLLDMGVAWKATGSNSYEASDRNGKLFAKPAALIWSSEAILNCAPLQKFMQTITKTNLSKISSRMDQSHGSGSF